MSDAPQGEGWWQASDGRWYPPESAPGGAPADPGAGQPFTPPSPAGPSPDPIGFQPPPAYGSEPPGPGPGYGAPQQQPHPNYGPPPGPAPYGAPPQKSNSKTIWIVLGVIVGGIVLLCGGCVALAAFGASQAEDSIGEVFTELGLDFTGASPALGPSSCEVTGIQNDGSGDYEVVATITNASGVRSHYRIDYDLSGPSGFLGSDFGIISDVDAGETVSDPTFGVVDGDPNWPDVTCVVTGTGRIDAE